MFINKYIFLKKVDFYYYIKSNVKFGSILTAPAYLNSLCAERQKRLSHNVQRWVLCYLPELQKQRQQQKRTKATVNTLIETYIQRYNHMHMLESRKSL